LTVKVTPQRGDGLVVAEEDYVRLVIDVEQVNIARRVEERNWIGRRRRKAVLR
jgi:hypothetical protein